MDATARVTRVPRRRRRRSTWIGAALFTSALAAAACGDPAGPLPREGPPDILEFSIGGFAIDTRSWVLQGDTVVFHRVPWDYDGSGLESVRVVPTAEAWEGFWLAARNAGVGRWGRRYVAHGVVDGLAWGLHLVSGRLRVESEGSNAYPDRHGRKHELEATATFQAFVSALYDLLEEEEP